MLESVPYCWASASRPNTLPPVPKKGKISRASICPKTCLLAPAPKSILFLVHDRPARKNEEAGYLLVQVQPVVSSEPKNIRLPLLVHLRLLYLSCLLATSSPIIAYPLLFIKGFFRLCAILTKCDRAFDESAFGLIPLPLQRVLGNKKGEGEGLALLFFQKDGWFLGNSHVVFFSH